MVSGMRKSVKYSKLWKSSISLKEDPDSWGGIDFIAFETVPLARKTQRAIRGALGRTLDNTSLVIKQWQISTVRPDGRYPQESTLVGEGLDVRIRICTSQQGCTRDFSSRWHW